MGRRGEDYASYEGDDDSGGAASFGEAPSAGYEIPPEVLARADSSPRRRHSRGGMGAATRSGHNSGSGSRGHSRGRSRGFKFNASSLREAAGSMLTVAVAGVIVCAIILYFTFMQAIIPQFYGALGASMVVMFLICFVAARLLGSE
ncbi:hypothetical protein [Methanocella arvoryzae]|uniref:Uncharacterized protein n=1 Tax=Methanocella arvoryzae (strain DSM 22066 / NBRC 105507 / MRE50) TaxID=351160 RepID=Q0W3T5_METAR|nr:hypothetical protein [Methanocella arvoryzae]CAJ36958.1 hypothetical protein RCIX1749 [Methanocella arvoryzae MRE50]